MINSGGAIAPIAGRFRPESRSHFKEVAKNMAFLLDRPLQKCQEDLARIYGYSGLHELQEILKKPGVAGPFAPRYNYLDEGVATIVEGQERRIFFILFGTHSGNWREDFLAHDRCFLVFEMGLFQEAAEQRACFEKIKHALTYGTSFSDWPLIHGWPLGLKSLLAAQYTEPVDLVENWQNMLPIARYAPIECADIGWQRRSTGLVRLATLFQILAPRVRTPKPTGMGKVSFDNFEDDGGGINYPSWEGHHLAEWLEKKLVQKTGLATRQQKELIQEFVQRPSKETAASCEFARSMKDPAGFRDRWAFECYKSALNQYSSGSKAQFGSSLDEGAIQSLCLHMDKGSVQISEGYGCQLWQLHYTRSDLIEPASAGHKPGLQPVIHANGSLIVPFDSNLDFMPQGEWHMCHDDSDFATVDAAVAFDEIYLPAIGVKDFDLGYRDMPFSIIEIDELLIATGVSAAVLESYFVRLLDLFDDNCLPDSYGYWAQTLSLDSDDEEENGVRNQDNEYAAYVYPPSVILINVAGGGLTFVNAKHINGHRVSTLRRATRKTPATDAAALANMVVEAIKSLDVDVVVYDGDA